MSSFYQKRLKGFIFCLAVCAYPYLTYSRLSPQVISLHPVWVWVLIRNWLIHDYFYMRSLCRHWSSPWMVVMPILTPSLLTLKMRWAYVQRDSRSCRGSLMEITGMYVRTLMYMYACICLRNCLFCRFFFHPIIILMVDICALFESLWSSSIFPHITLNLWNSHLY